MNKIMFILFILAFFIDFSFTPSLLGSELSWPYVMLSLLTLIFLFSKGTQENILWGALAIILLNILLPFNFFGYSIIVVIIWGVIYFLKNAFFGEELNYVKSNFSFILVFLLFGILFFVGQKIETRIMKEVCFSWSDINWKMFATKILIGIIVFNLMFKIWLGKESNTQVLK